MWLLTPVGFFSIVEKPGDAATATLTVRARVRSDLDALRTMYLPELSPSKETRAADYRFRASAPREAVAAAMSKLAKAIDYSNFKDAVAKRQGKARAELYHGVWDVLCTMQSSPNFETRVGRSGKANRIDD